MGKRGHVPWERIPPVHKPWKRNVCEWVTGIGWVFNPGRVKYE